MSFNIQIWARNRKHTREIKLEVVVDCFLLNNLLVKDEFHGAMDQRDRSGSERKERGGGEMRWEWAEGERNFDIYMGNVVLKVKRQGYFCPIKEARLFPFPGSSIPDYNHPLHHLSICIRTSFPFLVLFPFPFSITCNQTQFNEGMGLHSDPFPFLVTHDGYFAFNWLNSYLSTENFLVHHNKSQFWKKKMVWKIVCNLIRKRKQ